VEVASRCAERGITDDLAGHLAGYIPLPKNVAHAGDSKVPSLPRRTVGNRVTHVVNMSTSNVRTSQSAVSSELAYHRQLSFRLE
jgi:hypothetical protein